MSSNSFMENKTFVVICSLAIVGVLVALMYPFIRSVYCVFAHNYGDACKETLW